MTSLALPLRSQAPTLCPRTPQLSLISTQLQLQTLRALWRKVCSSRLLSPRRRKMGKNSNWRLINPQRDFSRGKFKEGVSGKSRRVSKISERSFKTRCSREITSRLTPPPQLARLLVELSRWTQQDRLNATQEKWKLLQRVFWDSGRQEWEVSLT